MKEELREMKDAQYSFNRNLRKIIQTRGEKIIQKNSPDPKKDTGLHMGKPGSEKNEEDKQQDISRQNFKPLKI